MALHILEEAERCLNCKKPLCQKGCPVGTAIPLVIQLFRERRMDDAGVVLFQNNPMSAVCSLICNHGAQCEGHCVRGRKGSPIHFSAIESYVSGTYLERIRFQRPEPCGRRAAVIGDGPAGIVAALRLAQAGVAVTVFDQNPRLGGVMRYGIPEYRLPKRLVDRYQEILESLGVRVRHNTAIGESLTIADLFRDGYDAVFVGTGTWRAQTLGVSGEAGGNVLFGLDYLMSPETAEIGERVAVIGAGNTAMDVAHTAFRQGASEVTLYARSRHISASSDELEYALLDGCELVQGKAICEINEHGLLVVDEHGMCTVPGVFAAGDVVTGPNTVVHAVAATKVAVDGMLEYMGVGQGMDIE